eukprot:4795044-Amphidinium_carterae.1
MHQADLASALDGSIEVVKFACTCEEESCQSGVSKTLSPKPRDNSEVLQSRGMSSQAVLFLSWLHHFDALDVFLTTP